MDKLTLITMSPAEFEQLADLVAQKVLVTLSQGITASRKPEQQYLTRQQVAKALSVTVQTVSTWTDKGTLKAYRFGNGRRVLYKVEEVEAALKGTKKPAVKPVGR